MSTLFSNFFEKIFTELLFSFLSHLWYDFHAGRSGQKGENQGGEIQPPVPQKQSKEVVVMSNYELFMAILAVAGIVINLVIRK